MKKHKLLILAGTIFTCQLFNAMESSKEDLKKAIELSDTEKIEALILNGTFLDDASIESSIEYNKRRIRDLWQPEFDDAFGYTEERRVQIDFEANCTAVKNTILTTISNAHEVNNERRAAAQKSLTGKVPAPIAALILGYMP